MRTFHKISVVILALLLTGNLKLNAQQFMRFPDISENSVVFTSGEDIWTAPLEGGDARRLTIHDGQERYPKFSPDGKMIAYNKVGTENRTWKRYTGGLAQEIYIYNFENNVEENISDFKGTDRMPMWIGNTVYFVSDRDRYLNIYAYNTDSKEITQVTSHNDYDVLRSSARKDKIVYEKGGKIWLLDINTKKSSEINIKINTDAPETRPYIKNLVDNIQGFDISPSGIRALVVARGEVFSVPKSSGITQNLSDNCGARDKDAVWSNNGQKIVFADQTLRCYILDVNSKQVTEVDQAKYENVDESLYHKAIYDYSWSPDSKYLAYSKMNKDNVYQIYIYSLENKKVYPVSDGLFYDFNPVFTKDGEHLLFVSDRRFNPTFCDIEWEMVYKDVAGIYALTLKKDGESILPFKNDIEKGQNKSAKQASAFRIDFEGLERRIEALPLPAGNYRDLAVNESNIFYLNSEDGDYNRMDYRELGPRTLYSYSFESREEKTVI
ncbi:MAG: hypothetical protein MUO72_00795 [Bacteroidales bacterium]|nr:hypothetical protein [Bacteroidales bacterium]